MFLKLAWLPLAPAWPPPEYKFWLRPCSALSNTRYTPPMLATSLGTQLAPARPQSLNGHCRLFVLVITSGLPSPPARPQSHHGLARYLSYRCERSPVEPVSIPVAGELLVEGLLSECPPAEVRRHVGPRSIECPPAGEGSPVGPRPDV